MMSDAMQRFASVGRVAGSGRQPTVLVFSKKIELDKAGRIVVDACVDLHESESR